MKELPLKQKCFFIMIYAVTLISFTCSIFFEQIEFNINNFSCILFFIVLTALTESFTVAYMDISFSTTFAITIASYVLLGPMSSIVIIIIGFLLRIVKLEDGTYNHFFNTPLYGTIFNCCVLTLPITVGNNIYTYLGGGFGGESISKVILPLILFSGIYFLLNSFIMAVMMAFYIEKNVLYCFLYNIKLGIFNYLIMIPFGIILAIAFREYSYWGVLLILFPALLARYTFSIYVESKSQYIQTVEALMNAIEARDEYTQGHSRRVAEISVSIAKALKYNQWKLEKLTVAAMLHDLGKIGVSDNILNKPDKLTEEEFIQIKNHPSIGYNILRDVKNLEYISPIVKNHHERYDGKGYPECKKGDSISLDTYIVQLADAVDAMASDRPYRKGLSKDQIMVEIEKNLGTQFHPKIARLYLDILKNTN